MTNEQQKRLNKLEVKLEVETRGYELKSAMLEEKEQEISDLNTIILELKSTIENYRKAEESYLNDIDNLKEEVEGLTSSCNAWERDYNELLNGEESILNPLTELLQRHITYGESIDYFIQEAKLLLNVKE